ncbi:MAG: hypothetical protein M1514_02700 [Patescibacteria group bacterium]|nr:hypothetical protein [Patescibacteria group bacterium]
MPVEVSSRHELNQGEIAAGTSWADRARITRIESEIQAMVEAPKPLVKKRAEERPFQRSWVQNVFDSLSFPSNEDGIKVFTQAAALTNRGH